MKSKSSFIWARISQRHASNLRNLQGLNPEILESYKGNCPYGIRHGVNGIWIYDTGNTTISGNSDVGLAQATTSIKAYINNVEHQGNVKIKAKLNTQGYINFNTTASDGLLFIATKDAVYVYCGLNIIYVLQTNHKCIR